MGGQANTSGKVRWPIHPEGIYQFAVMQSCARLTGGWPRSEVRAASDVARQQLGWYVRNCALSPAAGMLEGASESKRLSEPHRGAAEP